ncbi:MAG: ATP-binding cassette domain-containing protein [Candidatus Eisenbacteria sp.]|nr:ATP-binding cassette domain-containing protein [Candidatus Eisenbacteria bacterium]
MDETPATSVSHPILEIDDLVLDMGEKRVLDHLTLEFWPGHVHAVIGPNGAGKTTLAATIMGLAGYTQFSGDIRFGGESLRGLGVDQRAARGITLAWQEPARYEGLTIRSFIGAGARDRSEAALADVLARVGLDPAQYLDRAVDRTLSGGERKRVELASILAIEPRLVLMDEPDSGIDVEALNRIFDAIKHLKARGATVLLITHSLAVLRQADHAFLICSGKLMKKGLVGKIEEFFGDACLPCSHQNEPEPGKRDRDLRSVAEDGQ